MFGLIGKKIGMTHVFNEEGRMVPVTAILAGPCFVMSVKEKAIAIAFDPAPEKNLKKPQAGAFKKLKLVPMRIIREVGKEKDKEYKIGDELKSDRFVSGEYVDVTGVSKGKGFQGGMKRWHWAGGPQTHGSTSHRRVGSIGSTTTPGRVWKGHHMPGHMGNERVTVQNLEVVTADAESNLLLIKGAVPGANNSYCVVYKSLKKQTAKQKPKSEDAQAGKADKAKAKPKK